MDLKELYGKLASLEGGAEMESVIKAELTALRNEAATNRIALAESKKAHEELLKELSITDEASKKQLQKELDAIKKSGKKPDEMNTQLEELNKQLDEMKATAEAEKTKRVSAIKQSAALTALQKGNATSPENISKLILDNIVIKDDDSVVFALGDKEHSVNDGVSEWLKANTWAVKVDSSGGLGGGTPSGQKAPTTLYDAVEQAINK